MCPRCEVNCFYSIHMARYQISNRMYGVDLSMPICELSHNTRISLIVKKVQTYRCSRVCSWKTVNSSLLVAYTETNQLIKTEKYYVIKNDIDWTSGSILTLFCLDFERDGQWNLEFISPYHVELFFPVYLRVSNVYIWRENN